MFLEGQQIGSYTLLRKLGRGGFGEVWLAEKRSQFVTKKVAVKLPLDEQINFDAIRQEAGLWEQASGHANVLPIIDADIVNGQVVIVSEYADGGSLHDRLRTQGKLPIKQAVEMTVGILNGLEFLHNRKIIHRDIKPQNILLQGDNPRLADFGISRAMQTTAISSKLVGTDAYMSPESFDGKRSVQTDIWSVGVVLYQLLAGSLPFPQEHPSERIFAILTKEFPPLPVEVPNSLQRIVAKSLAKQSENRYQTAGEMREELNKALVGIEHPTLAKTEVLHLPISNQTITDISTIDELLKTEEPRKETAINNPPINLPIIWEPLVEPKAAATQFKQVPLTEVKPLSTEAQKVVAPTQNAKSEINPYLFTIAAPLGIFLLIGLIGVIGFILTPFFSKTSKTGNSSSNVNSSAPVLMNIELKFFESVPLTIKVDGKSDFPLGTTKFTAQNSFTLEYNVYQVDKFQLKINGKIIKLSKSPPIGPYSSVSKLEVTKDNLNQILQNSSNETSSASTTEMNIELSTTAKVYFIATIDGKDDTFFSEAGTTKKYSPKNYFQLSYSKVAYGLVQLKLNGKSIQVPDAEAPKETMVDFKISKRNLEQVLQSGKVEQTVTNH